MYRLQLKYIGYIKFPFHDFDKLFMFIFLWFIGTKKKFQRFIENILNIIFV